MGSEKKKSSSEAERAAQAEIEQHKTARFISFYGHFADVAKVGVKWGVAAIIAWQFREAVGSIAGQSTTFQALTDVAFRVDVSKYAGYVLAAVLGVDSYRQRKLRTKEVRELSARNKQLEETVDPERSSSGLTPEGTPPPLKLLQGRGDKP